MRQSAAASWSGWKFFCAVSGAGTAGASGTESVAPLTQHFIAPPQSQHGTGAVTQEAKAVENAGLNASRTVNKMAVTAFTI